MGGGPSDALPVRMVLYTFLNSLIVGQRLNLCEVNVMISESNSRLFCCEIRPQSWRADISRSSILLRRECWQVLFILEKCSTAATCARAESIERRVVSGGSRADTNAYVIISIRAARAGETFGRFREICGFFSKLGDIRADQNRR